MSMEAPSTQTNDKNGFSRRRYPHIVLPTLLIIVGTLMLLNNLGVLPWSFWGSIWRLWPLILILLGIEVIVTGRGGWSAVGAAIGLVSIVALIGVIGFIVGPRLGWVSAAEDTWGQVPIPFGQMISGSGNLVTEEKDFSGFSEIEASGVYDLEISRGDSFSTVITVDDNLLDHVGITQDGQRLKLFLKNLSLTGPVTIKAKITMPELRELHVGGACKANVQGFESSGNLNLEASGASNLRGHVEAGSLRVETSGASRVTLDGSADDVGIYASGASHLEMAGFTAGTANVQMSGASGGELTVTERLDTDLSGASWLTYHGNPTLGRTQTSGGSQLRQN